MTKKDYELIAQALGEGLGNAIDHNLSSHQFAEEVVNTMALHLSKDNPRFNKNTFIKVTEGWVMYHLSEV